MPESIRLLIVDDHAVVRKGLAMVLRLEPDLEVVGEAENGRVGLEAAKSLDPDIVLVDLVMPEMDGHEMALEYARQRVQGRVPIIQHQSIKMKLFEMFRKVEAARALNRRVVLYNTVHNPYVGAPAGSFPAVQYAIASKVTSTQTSFDVATDALQVFGGNGLSYEYPIEKILRDARASLIEDGTNEVLALHAAERL